MNPREAEGNPPEDPARDERIENEASLWAGRWDGGLRGGERERLRDWLDRDPRHAAAFRRYRLLARKLEGLRAYAPAPVLREPERPAVSRRWTGVGLAFGAAAALAAVAVWRPIPSSGGAVAHSYATPAGMTRSVDLPDGSRVHLNAGSGASVRYLPGERQVALERGEAHFEVVPEPGRPFVVVVGEVRVRAVGTAFLVRREGHEVEVVVTEGTVDVSSGYEDDRPDRQSGVERLTAGRRTVLREDGGRGGYATFAPAETLTDEEIGRRLAWKAGRVDFPPTPLRDVVTQMNRYGGRSLRLADPSLETLSVGGSFRPGDPENFAALMEAGFRLRVERTRDEIVLHPPSGATPYSIDGDN